jgi:TolA-binding protein
MRTPVAALALFLLAVAAPHAEEPPHLQFVQGLREKQLPDLALEYLEALQKKALPAEVATLLPLESAKARLALAELETEPGRRTNLREQARNDLQTFAQKHPGHPLAADANLELARVVVLQGKEQLTRAHGNEDKAGTAVDLRKARSLFEQAGRELEAASKQIDAQLTTYAEPKNAAEEAAKRTLSRSRIQAEFERGTNFLDQAQTYTEERELLKRGEIVKKAIATLERASRQEPKNPTCSLARVWLGRAHFENDNPQEADRVYKEVIGEPGEYSEAARRLARWFRLQVLSKDQAKKDAPAQVQREAERWLNDYKGHLNTPEGYGVRYELAEALLAQAVALPKTQAVRARDFYTRAQKLYQALELADNNYSEAAREKKLNIVLTLSEERSRGDITKLADFEECYLRAQLEVARLNRAEKELKGDQLAGQRDEHIRNIVQALTRGLSLADAKVPAPDLGDARYLLTRAYYSQEDYYRTAVLGEELARTASALPRAPQAATYALYAYAQLIAAGERASAGAETLDADRNRLRKLAEYVEKTWPNDNAADVARHQLGAVAWGEKKYPQAVAALGRISSSYANATHSNYLLAMAALQADKAGIAPPPGKPPYLKLAIAGLTLIPDPAPGIPSAVVQTYLEAKLQLGGLLYSAGNFKELEELASALTKTLAGPGLGLDDAARSEFRPRVRALDLLARYGQGEADYRAGQYAKVCAALEPIVNQLRNPATKQQLTEIKHPGLVNGLLSLALRANVQDNKMDRAKDILDLLQASDPDNAVDTLRDLLRQLSVQIQDLRQKGDVAKEQLNRTVSSFGVFLDVLAKQQEKTPDAGRMLFLADGYALLDKHDTAAQLLKQVPEPLAEGDAKEPDPKKVQLYRAVRILYVRELRLARQFAEAAAELDHLTGTADKPRWGQGSFELLKERMFLLEDQGKFGGTSGAVQGWIAAMRSMQRRIKQDARVREQYYECYFHLTHSLYKHALTIGDAAKRRKSLQQAANYVVQLERTQPDMGGAANQQRFADLLEKEPALRELCDELRKAGK